MFTVKGYWTEMEMALHQKSIVVIIIFHRSQPSPHSWYSVRQRGNGVLISWVQLLVTQRSKRKVFFVFFECQISNLQLGTFWRARFPHSPIDINYVYNTRLKLYAWSVRKCFPISCHRNNNLTHERNIKKKAMRISPFCTVLSRAVCCICTANDDEK